mmetsp:Transcript_32094/g.73853  ORF Transcript_32094/g.73853 Transcript_32094/m.73853 type:complete len:84 (+) Transcript_32094:185-436(+)
MSKQLVKSIVDRLIKEKTTSFKPRLNYKSLGSAFDILEENMINEVARGNTFSLPGVGKFQYSRKLDEVRIYCSHMSLRIAFTM